MVSAVTRAYREYDVDQLARVHALTYVVYREILENLGSNQCDMPHTGIRVRQTSGHSSDDRTISNDVVRAAREFVRRNVNAEVYATETTLNTKLLLPIFACYTKRISIKNR